MRFWLLLITSVACVHNTQDSRREAASVFVSGKAYLCTAPGGFGKPAQGRAVRLVTHSRVLAEDIVGPDGSYVLHPRAAEQVTEPVYVEAGSKRVTLANNYASWIQDHIHYDYTVYFP